MEEYDKKILRQEMDDGEERAKPIGLEEIKEAIKKLNKSTC